MMNKNIFVACDTSSVKKVKKIITHTKTEKLQIIPKFGLQFFYASSFNFLNKSFDILK